MNPAVLPRDPDRVHLSTLAGEVPTGIALMSLGIRRPLPPLIKLPNNSSRGDSSVGVDLEDVDMVEVLTLVSSSLTSISPINDIYCVCPTPIQGHQFQLDLPNVQNVIVTRAQNRDILVSKPVISKTINPIVTHTLKLDVSCHVVTPAHIVPLHGPLQKKGLSPDQSLNRIKHVKGVCCVNPCLSAPLAPNVPSAVTGQSVGGRL